MADHTVTTAEFKDAFKIHDMIEATKADAVAVLGPDCRLRGTLNRTIQTFQVEAIWTNDPA